MDKLGIDVSILLVDDEDFLLEIFQETLAGAGYLVRTANGSDAAFAISNDPAARIDLLVTDVNMPGKTGLELAALLRKTRPGLRVLFMSGIPGGKDMEEAMKIPGTGFIQKPMSPDGLMEKIREMLGA